MAMAAGRHGMARAAARERAVRVPGAISVRAAALGGAVFFALILAYATLISGSPAATDSGQEIFDDLSQRQGRFQLAAVLLGLAMPAALVFLSGLFRALSRAEGGGPALAWAGLGGGILAAASTVTGALILGTTAVRIEEIGAAGASVWWTMYLLSVGATLLGLLLLIGVTAIVSLHTKIFPRWFVAASILLALTSVVGACTIGYAATGIQVVAGVAMLLDSIWIFVASWYLWRDPALALPVTTSDR